MGSPRPRITADELAIAPFTTSRADCARSDHQSAPLVGIGDELLLVKHSVALLLTPQGLIVADEIYPETKGALEANA